MAKPQGKKKGAAAKKRAAPKRATPKGGAQPKRAGAPGSGRRSKTGAPAEDDVVSGPRNGTALAEYQDQTPPPGLVREVLVNGDARESKNAPKGKYVYCIIRSPAPLKFGALGLGTEPSHVHTINYRDLAAVVSDTPMGVHDPTRENVLAHQRVNETVMREHTVIPMSFGTVFRTRDDIIELLRSAYDAFGDVLTKMQNKLEFGLKVLWDRDAIVKEIETDDEDVRRLKSEIQTQKGSTYFARMQYGRLIDAALQQRSERYVSDIFSVLRDVSVASRSNKPIGDKMIMNAAFLVMREKETAFDAKVKSIAEKYDKCTFKYTGPWPPYNFVNIRLKLERAK
jgi:hypothetical protein